jgi:hypothetical protein
MSTDSAFFVIPMFFLALGLVILILVVAIGPGPLRRKKPPYPKPTPPAPPPADCTFSTSVDPTHGTGILPENWPDNWLHAVPASQWPTKQSLGAPGDLAVGCKYPNPDPDSDRYFCVKCKGPCVRETAYHPDDVPPQSGGGTDLYTLKCEECLSDYTLHVASKHILKIQVDDPPDLTPKVNEQGMFIDAAKLGTLIHTAIEMSHNTTFKSNIAMQLLADMEGKPDPKFVEKVLGKKKPEDVKPPVAPPEQPKRANRDIRY